ncbi:MAG TPA: tripartite tricarboxylate transporter permease [bacterium]|nr:tripartite tricarboxylate transporter permease [bacterium]
MLEAIWHGLNLALSWPAIGLILVAVPIGMLFGAIPGLGGNLGLALMIPFVFGMTPAAGFAFLLGMHSVVHTGGALPAILFGTPGTGPSAAAVADGYALTKQGLAARAMGAALGASLLGGIVGDLFLAALIPMVRPIVLAFGPSEIFTVAVLGITLIAAVSRGSILKGLLAGALGLALSTVGLDPQTGIGRLTFGQLWLWNGINLVTVVVGLFGLAEVIEMGWQRAAIAHAGLDPGTRYTLRGVAEGLMDVRRHAWLCVRCGLIGAFVGMIPGLGGDAASWICYGHAGQTSKHPETFGKGNVEGVIGPESANHAKEGGGLIPTVAFGVPGGSGMAILLGAFVILGLEPGPLMLIKHLDVVWAMVWILGLANVLAVAVFLAASGLIARVSFLRVSLIVPFVLMFIVLGSFLSEGAWQNMILTLGAGALGYAMKKFGYPRAPVVIGFVLGRLAETNLTLALQLWGWAFLLRPLTALLLGLAALSVATHVWAQIRRRGAAPAAHPETRPSTPLSGVLTAAFGGYLGIAFGYPGLARLMPLVVGIPGLMLAGAQFVLDLRGGARAARAAAAKPRIAAAGALAATARVARHELGVLWWAAGLVGLTLAFGFSASIPLFLAAFLRLRGKESWPVTVALAGTGWAFVYLVFTVGMKVFLFRGFVVRWLT